MKVIKKSTLFALLEITRNYAKTGNQCYLSVRIEIAKELAKQAYGNDNAWLAFVDFAEGTCGTYALYNNCTTETFCELFKVLGFAIIDD